MAEATGKIYTAISAIMDECPAIAKDQKNQNFMYRGVDTVMNVLQPLMSKHKVFAVPEVLECERSERTTKSGSSLLYTVLKVKYTFYAEDGSSVCAVVQGEGMDSADKSSNKAMSVAFKYACFQVFCIPTEEMKDPDAETPPTSAAVPQCSDCGAVIKGTREFTAQQIAQRACDVFGKPLCIECAKKAKEGAGNG
jgi:hypothetical protein|nr:MAG TPA: ERF superfamily protein [Caudoviricetes sp.]